jgi:hypothetical protein
MTRDRSAPFLAGLSLLSLTLPLSLSLGACAPTIHIKLDPITINAKLDADVRIRLDKEVQSAIAANPNIF